MSIYQHFRPEERDFIDQVLGWKDYVESSYAPRLTDFLDPREQQIIKALIGTQSEVQLEFFGGYSDAERKRALLFLDYMEPGAGDFHLTLFELEYAKKFVTIEHRQVLGSLMSLGLKRGKFGDILVSDEQVQFVACQEVADYVKVQLDKVGNAGISLKELPLESAIAEKEEWNESAVTSSSLRLDTIVSTIYRISRQKSQLLVQQGRVKVNWKTSENPAFELAEGDIISIRGMGRTKIVTVEGKTKKDNWRIIAGRKK
ncbi:YlmH family RNA-binding protein [Bacillus massilinigeriensis]|uniref:YlmH family RNA-binding protein n=1 Tax=Bacillus mediterraneensis TaxID=1805474 RepID=UPI0008F80999|nr:RNA-binding protein [Bacillus mediterraneensis]